MTNLHVQAKTLVKQSLKRTMLPTFPLAIACESEGFQQGGPVSNGIGTLQTSWSELLWAAVTVGRPNRQFVFKHGSASMYEALFRLSLVRMALEQTEAQVPMLRRTVAVTALDPTEKGATNYFLGLAIGKLFAAKMLHAPWMLHLDVVRDKLDHCLVGRSRPDLVGAIAGGRGWVVLECKGRGSPPDLDTKNKAKEQAKRLTKVGGAPPAFLVGGVTFFDKGILHFYWCDPETDSEVKNPIEFDVEAEMWRHYYGPVLSLVQSNQDQYGEMLQSEVLVDIGSADLKVGIRPGVLRLLVESRWEEARKVAEIQDNQPDDFSYQADGIAIVAGESWSKPFVDLRVAGRGAE